MYKVISKWVIGQDTEVEFNTFKEAIKHLESEIEDTDQYFCTEKISKVFYKIYYRRETYPFGWQYAGCTYLKKVA